MMLDISKTYSLGYVKIDNLLWHEIDNEEHYNYVINKLLKRIDKKEKSVLLENLKEIICNCMNIESSEINSIYEFIDGQKSVYSIDMEQAKILKEIVNKEMEEN